MTQPTDVRELIEDAAKTVYASMQWAARHAENGSPPNWVERGNSLAQAEARGAARAIVESLLSHIERLEEALRPFAAMRLSTEPEVSDLVWRSHGAQLREQAAAIELRDAQIAQARDVLRAHSTVRG